MKFLNRNVFYRSNKKIFMQNKPFLIENFFYKQFSKEQIRKNLFSFFKCFLRKKSFSILKPLQIVKSVKIFLFSAVLLGSAPTAGKLNIVTSTTNLKSLAGDVGKEHIHLESITKGPQDPHYLLAKPSYMLKARRADLLILIGMDLEIGWLPNIIQGARNPRIQKGRSGHLDTSQFIKALSVPEGKVDRFFGDIHPFGNPHFLLDPVRALQVSKGISQKFSELDPENKDEYMKNQEQVEKGMRKKIQEWEMRIKDSGVKNVVTYHSSFEYFLDRFQLNLIGLIEEKPGIPPSAKHVLKLIKKIKTSQSSCILMSSFYSDKWVQKIKKAVPVHIEVVAIETMALKKAKDYTSVIEGIVQAIENCGAYASKNKMEKT